MWPRTEVVLVLVALALGLGAVSVPAQEGSAPPPSGGTGEPNAEPPAGGGGRPKDEPMLVSFDELIANEKGDGIWEMIGQVKMTQGTTEMYADRCEWNRNTNFATFTNNVKIVDPPSNTLTCRKCVVDLDQEIATLTEDVVVKSKNEPKPKDEKPNPDSDPYEYGEWTTTCDRVIYDYGKDKGRAEGNVVSKSEDKKWTIETQLALYEVNDKNEEVITLPNNPKITSSDQFEHMTIERVVITLPEGGMYRVQMYKGTGTLQPDKDRGEKPKEGEGGSGAQPPPAPAAEPGGQGPGFEGMPPEGDGTGGTPGEGGGTGTGGSSGGG
jgi:hypothetical protein